MFFITICLPRSAHVKKAYVSSSMQFTGSLPVRRQVGPDRSKRSGLSREVRACLARHHFSRRMSLCWLVCPARRMGACGWTQQVSENCKLGRQSKALPVWSTLHCLTASTTIRTTHARGLGKLHLRRLHIQASAHACTTSLALQPHTE